MAALLAYAIAFSGKLEAELISKTITVTWDPSPSGHVAGYRIRYGIRSEQYSKIIEVPQPTADIPNLIDGTTYFFAVTAYTLQGEESLPSQEFIYTPNAATFLNISTRAMVQGGDGALISGFIIGGSGPKTVVARALGPSLAVSGVSNPLSDPVLQIQDSNGMIAENDNWQGDTNPKLVAYGLVPEWAEESALIVTLLPGAYTAVVRGKDATAGVALLEVYDGGVPLPQ